MLRHSSSHAQRTGLSSSLDKKVAKTLYTPDYTSMIALTQHSDSTRVQAARDRLALKRTLEKYGKDRVSARGFLQRAGIIDASGKLTKAYR